MSLYVIVTPSGDILLIAKVPKLNAPPARLIGNKVRATSAKFSVSNSPSLMIPSITFASPVIKLVKGIFDNSSKNSIKNPFQPPISAIFLNAVGISKLNLLIYQPTYARFKNSFCNILLPTAFIALAPAKPNPSEKYSEAVTPKPFNAASKPPSVSLLSNIATKSSPSGENAIVI